MATYSIKESFHTSKLKTEFKIYINLPQKSMDSAFDIEKLNIAEWPEKVMDGIVN